MTTFVSPNAESPAVRAKGTVRPSESPMMASEITRASTWNLRFGSAWVESRRVDVCEDTEPFDSRSIDLLEAWKSFSSSCGESSFSERGM